MEITLKLFLLMLLLFQLILIVRTTKLKKLSLKYSTFWIFLLIIMAIIVIFPNIVFTISDVFGFATSSNMVFLLGFFFLYYIIFILTTSISVQNEKIKLLIQELSLLKEKVNKNGKKG